MSRQFALLNEQPEDEPEEGLRVGLDHMERAGWISAYDRVVGDRLAWVLAGGDVSPSSRA